MFGVTNSRAVGSAEHLLGGEEVSVGPLVLVDL